MGQPQAVLWPPAGAPLPLEANLAAFDLDDDTEETPPTAVPGTLSFALDWEIEDDEDDEDASGASPAPACRSAAPPAAADPEPPRAAPSAPATPAEATSAIPETSSEAPSTSAPAAPAYRPPTRRSSPSVPVSALGVLGVLALAVGLLVGWWLRF